MSHPQENLESNESTNNTIHANKTKENLTEQELKTLAEQPEEMFGIYNENHEFIGLVPRKIVHRDGLLHKSVNGFLVHQGSVLLQQRSKYKLSEPLKWDVSVAEHLQYPESFKEAVIRGLMEELGFDASSCSVTSMRDTHETNEKYHLSDGSILHDYEITELYLVESDSSERPSFRMLEAEVQDIQWVKLEDLVRLKSELEFTRWAKIEIEFLIRHFQLI